MPLWLMLKASVLFALHLKRLGFVCLESARHWMGIRKKFQRLCSRHLCYPFFALYATVQSARNDAMHIGAYARHATEAAIELCIGLEEALMAGVNSTVGNLMVTSPISVEQWQPIAHARQLMLMHSFSFLPVRLDDGWYLLSELGLAQYLVVKSDIKTKRLGQTIKESKSDGLKLIKVPEEKLLNVNHRVDDLLSRANVENGSRLWLVVDDARKNHLAGVISPFELM